MILVYPFTMTIIKYNQMIVNKELIPPPLLDEESPYDHDVTPYELMKTHVTHEMTNMKKTCLLVGMHTSLMKPGHHI